MKKTIVMTLIALGLSVSSFASGQAVKSIKGYGWAGNFVFSPGSRDWHDKTTNKVFAFERFNINDLVDSDGTTVTSGLAVAVYTKDTNSVAYVNKGNGWESWNGDVSNLKNGLSIGADIFGGTISQTDMGLFVGDLPIGNYTLYAGFVMKDGTLMVANAVSPIKLTIN